MHGGDSRPCGAHQRHRRRPVRVAVQQRTDDAPVQHARERLVVLLGDASGRPGGPPPRSSGSAAPWGCSDRSRSTRCGGRSAPGRSGLPWARTLPRHTPPGSHPVALLSAVSAPSSSRLSVDAPGCGRVEPAALLGTLPTFRKGRPDPREPPRPHPREEKHPDAFVERYTDRTGGAWGVLKHDSLRQVLAHLKDDPQLDFKLFVSIDAVDRLQLPDSEPRFEVVYFLYSITRNEHVRLKVRVAEEDPEIPSVTPSSRAPTGASGSSGTSTAFASRATAICAACSCTRSSRGTRCARTTRCAIGSR